MGGKLIISLFLIIPSEKMEPPFSERGVSFLTEAIRPGGEKRSFRRAQSPFPPKKHLPYVCLYWHPITPLSGFLLLSLHSVEG